jgi:ComEC/Rec2-related protein
LIARRSPIARAAAIVLLAFALGAVDSGARTARGTAIERLAHDVAHCRFAGRTLEPEGGLGTLVALEELACRDASPLRDAGLAFMREETTAGARVSGEGWLVPLGDDGFGAARRRFGGAAELSVAHLETAEPTSGLLGLAASIRTRLSAAVRDMPADRAGLLTGVTTGDTHGLNEQVIGDFRRSGLSHLVAVSGENVVMVLGALALVTRRLASRIRAAMALSLLGLFVVVVGPQPSVLRAAAMAVVAIAALAYGLRPEPWHALLLALIAVLALRPAILYSAGLHLSAAATAGILLWTRPLARHLPLPSGIALGLAVTLSAQLATAPLIAGLFGQVSLAGPVANLLALPAVPPATVLGLCAAAAGTVNPTLGGAMARCAEPFVAWVLFVARVLGRPSWAALTVPRWTGWVFGAAALCAAAAVVGRGQGTNVRVV